MSILRTRRSSKAAVIALAVAAATPDAALAGEGSANRPKISSLPDARLSSMTPTRAPAGVAATEKLAGFHVANPPGANYGKGGQRAGYVMLFPSKAAEEATFGRGAGGLPPAPDGTCFALSHGEPGPRGLFSNSSTMSVLTVPTNRDHYGAVRAVRSERLVPGASGRATLEITDAWLDPVTRGVRLARRASVSLVQVASGIGGLDVYAARDGQQAVELVVRTMTADLRRGQPGMTMTIIGDNVVNNSNCGHARVRLKLEKGAADMVTMNGELMLPSADEPKPPPAPAADAAEQPGVLARVFGSTPGQTLRMRDIRLRQVRVSGSTTWTSRDPEPVLSVSFGWQGRERTMQVPSFDR